MVEQGLRREVKPVVTALRLAQMSEAHLVIDDYWRVHFERKQAQNGGATPSVASLRKWLNEPRPMGLPVEVENLILLFLAERTSRVWFIYGSPCSATIDEIKDEAELREQTLPTDAQWDLAVKRASGVFGLTPAPLKTATNVAKLNVDLKAQFETLLEPARELARELRSRLVALDVQPESSARWKSASSGLALLEAFRAASDTDRVTALATIALDASDVAIGTALRQAVTVTRFLRDVQWTLLTAVAKLNDQRQVAGQILWARAQEVLRIDELAVALPLALRTVLNDAAKLLADVSVVRPPIPPEQMPTTPAPAAFGTGTTTVVGPCPVPGEPGTSTKPVGSPIGITIIAGNWGGSDEAEARAIYANDPDKLARNRRLVGELKALYRKSQVVGDVWPAGIPVDRLADVLEVHHIVPLAKGGPDERSNMIVLSPTLHALVHADPTCVIDLQKSALRVFGCELKIVVLAQHYG